MKRERKWGEFQDLQLGRESTMIFGVNKEFEGAMRDT